LVFEVEGRREKRERSGRRRFCVVRKRIGRVGNGFERRNRPGG